MIFCDKMDRICKPRITGTNHLFRYRLRLIDIEISLSYCNEKSKLKSKKLIETDPIGPDLRLFRCSETLSQMLL